MVMEMLSEHCSQKHIIFFAQIARDDDNLLIFSQMLLYILVDNKSRAKH